jgi:hypothetical protein
MEPRSIEEDALASFYILDAENSVSCGLGFFSNDGNFIPKEAVE